MKRQLLLSLASIMLCISGFAKEPQRPTSYNYNRGQEAIANGDYQTALKCFNDEIENNEKDGYSLSWVSYINLEYEEYGKALVAANAAIKYLPKKDKEYVVFAYSSRARAYENLKDTALALADWTQAIKTDPTLYRTIAQRAALYYSMVKYDLAEVDYRQLLNFTDNSALQQGYVGIGCIQRERKEYEDALATFTKLISMYPNFEEAYRHRAVVFEKMKRYEEMATDLVKSIELGSATAFYNMLYLEDNEAIRLMVDKLRLQTVFAPNQGYWWLCYGQMLEIDKQLKKAIDAYKKCEQLNSSDFVIDRLGDCYEKIGDYARALSYRNLLIERDSTDASNYAQRSSTYACMGNLENSIKDMTKYIELEPKKAWGYYRRGWYKHLLYRCEDAIDDLTLSLMIDPTYSYSYDALARCYAYLGDTVKAVETYKKLIANDTIPKSGNASYAYHFLGQDDKAIEWIEKVLEKDSTRNYAAACVYSLVGDTAKALYYLEKDFIQDGVIDIKHLERDEDLNNIRNLETYKTLVNKYYQKMLEQIEPADDKKSETIAVEVPFSKSNGVTKVDCTINGLPLNFVFDTGASDVTISQVEANFMFKNGYLNDKDVIGSQRYQTADGNISVGTTINLRQINFGGLELQNVRASVVRNQNAPLLLGQSVLQRLGKIEIDNEKRVLKITTR